VNRPPAAAAGGPVSHILSKLGARSRVEIVVEALRHASPADRAIA
jgi:hypothetical protein